MWPKHPVTVCCIQLLEKLSNFMHYVLFMMPVGLLHCLFSLPLSTPLAPRTDLSRLEAPTMMSEVNDTIDSPGEAVQQSLLAIRRVG